MNGGIEGFGKIRCQSSSLVESAFPFLGSVERNRHDGIGFNDLFLVEVDPNPMPKQWFEKIMLLVFVAMNHIPNDSLGGEQCAGMIELPFHIHTIGAGLVDLSGFFDGKATEVAPWWSQWTY